MRHGEFYIGKEFLTDTGLWRCTDKGGRTVIAVKVDDPSKNPSWYSGPPYAVEEVVFDENDFPACIPVFKNSEDMTWLERLHEFFIKWR